MSRRYFRRYGTLGPSSGDVSLPLNYCIPLVREMKIQISAAYLRHIPKVDSNLQCILSSCSKRTTVGSQWNAGRKFSISKGDFRASIDIKQVLRILI